MKQDNKYPVWFCLGSNRLKSFLTLKCHGLNSRNIDTNLEMLFNFLLVLLAFTGIVTSAPAALEPRVVPGVTWTVKSFTRSKQSLHNFSLPSPAFPSHQRN